MLYFNNFSNLMFTYLLMHGSYGKKSCYLSLLGVFWYLKDNIFPDPSFQSNITFMSAGVIWLGVLGPYLVPAYRLASGLSQTEESVERTFICILLYMFGLVFMLLSDSQKFYTLKYK